MIPENAINQYSITQPVSSSMFFGRKDELNEIIDNRLRQFPPISTILIGGRKIGKTSLLFKIRDQILSSPICLDSSRAIPIYISLQSLDIIGSHFLFQAIIVELVSQLKLLFGITFPIGELSEREPYRSFMQIMTFITTECHSKLGKIRFALLLDEAERLLGHSWTTDVISNLRDLINTSPLNSFFVLVITGFREFHDYAISEEDGIGSILGNAAYWTHLGVLSKDDASDLISKPINGKITPEIIDLVYEESGGHPAVTQFIMQQALEGGSREITKDLIMSICRNARKKIRIFSSWLSKFDEKDRLTYLLITQSKGNITYKDILKNKPKEINPSQIQESLDFLCYSGVICQENDNYTVAGCLFRDWFLIFGVRMKDGNMKNPNDKSRNFDMRKFIVSSIIAILIFVVTIAVLVWASSLVSPVTLAFVLIVALVFDMISIVTVLVINDVVLPKWAMNFYNNVLTKIPILKPLNLDIKQKTGKSEQEEDM